MRSRGNFIIIFLGVCVLTTFVVMGYDISYSMIGLTSEYLQLGPRLAIKISILEHQLCKQYPHYCKHHIVVIINVRSTVKPLI